LWTFELALPVAKFEARKRILEDVAVTKKGAEAAIALAALLPAGGKKAIGLLGESLAIGASAALDRSSDSWSQIVFGTLSKLWLIFKFWGWSSVGCRGKKDSMCSEQLCVAGMRITSARLQDAQRHFQSRTSTRTSSAMCLTSSVL